MIETLKQTQKAIAPPKRWRNRWWAEATVEFIDGPSRGPGEFLSRSVFPSKEVAEQRALAWMRKYYSRVVWRFYGDVFYLGSVPVDE